MMHNANPRGGPYLLFFQYRHLYMYVQTHRDGSHYYYHTSAHKRLLRAQGSPEGCQVLVAESVSVHWNLYEWSKVVTLQYPPPEE